MKDTITAYNAEDTNKFKTIVAFDCRGVEPVAFDPRVRSACWKKRAQGLAVLL